MPNGSTHTRAALATTAALTIGAVYSVLRYGHLEAMAIPAGALAGLLLTPDLDGNTISHEHARAVNPLFGWAWRVYWRPYAWIAKHRGLSHAPVFGTLVRLIYAGWWIIAILLYFQVDIPWAWIGTAAVGLAIVDCVHVGVDALSKWLKLARKVIA